MEQNFTQQWRSHWGFFSMQATPNFWNERLHTHTHNPQVQYVFRRESQSSTHFLAWWQSMSNDFTWNHKRNVHLFWEDHSRAFLHEPHIFSSFLQLHPWQRAKRCLFDQLFLCGLHDYRQDDFLKHFKSLSSLSTTTATDRRNAAWQKQKEQFFFLRMVTVNSSFLDTRTWITQWLEGAVATMQLTPQFVTTPQALCLAAILGLLVKQGIWFSALILEPTDNLFWGLPLWEAPIFSD